MSAARCRREGRTLRLSGQLLDAVDPKALHIEGDELPIKEIVYEHGDPTQDLEKWKDTGGIDPALKVDYTNGVSWGKYQQAVILWSNVTGVWPPHPTKPDGRNGRHRLSAGFAEWMMGWPAGHVTYESLGLTRTQQLKAVGNGVVTRQAIHAGNQLLERLGCKSHNASGF